jgi:hypothetical protein
MDILKRTILNVDWWAKATVRAIRTGAQVALASWTVGAILSAQDARNIALTAVFAVLYSYVTSLAGLPEVEDIYLD